LFNWHGVNEWVSWLVDFAGVGQWRVPWVRYCTLGECGWPGFWNNWVYGWVL